jgi:UPF0755 protein
MRLIKAIIALALVVAILGGAVLCAGWFWFQGEIAKAGPLEAELSFTVERGEALSTVAKRLEAEGIISDARLLRLQARLDGTGNAIKAGAYLFPPRISTADAMAKLIEGDVVQVRLTIPEALTTAQILRRVEAADVLIGPMPEHEIAEGTLLPDTYIFGEGTTRIQFIERMEKAQDDLIAQLWPQRQSGLPLATPEEALILASIVEKETGLAGERDKIAGLFIGRLNNGMRLQTDPTVIYGVSRGEPLLNRQGQRRTLYQSELDRKTDWNTYQIDGLPKTPICNPGREAIAAVLNPADTEYVFFVADGKGGHLFAKTLAEHNRNVAAYRAYEREEIARERAND